MYPDDQLTRLAVHKAAVRQRIAARRVVCVDNFTGAVRPLVLLDHLIALGRRIAPLAQALALPIGLFIGRAALPRTGFFGRLLRWAPVVFAAWHGLSAATRRPR